MRPSCRGSSPARNEPKRRSQDRCFADKQLWNQAQQGRLADALALRGDEGRDRLR